jgi:hypothetical protein
MRAAVIGALLLAGCAGAEPTGGGGQPPRTVDFTCEDGARLKVTFEGGTGTLVDPQGRSFHLAQQVAASVGGASDRPDARHGSPSRRRR